MIQFDEHIFEMGWNQAWRERTLSTARKGKKRLKPQLALFHWNGHWKWIIEFPIWGGSWPMRKHGNFVGFSPKNSAWSLGWLTTWCLLRHIRRAWRVSALVWLQVWSYYRLVVPKAANHWWCLWWCMWVRPKPNECRWSRCGRCTVRSKWWVAGCRTGMWSWWSRCSWDSWCRIRQTCRRRCWSIGLRNSTDFHQLS